MAVVLFVIQKIYILHIDSPAAFSTASSFSPPQILEGIEKDEYHAISIRQLNAALCLVIHFRVFLCCSFHIADVEVTSHSFVLKAIVYVAGYNI